MEEVGWMDSGSKVCLVHAMTAVVNFALWPHYSQERPRYLLEAGLAPEKSLAPSGIRTSDRQASSLVTVPTTLIQILPLGRTEELRKAQGSNSVKPTENRPRGDIVWMVGCGSTDGMNLYHSGCELYGKS